MDSKTASVLEVKKLSKRFDMTQALEGISLKLFAGEVHVIVGENGAGKSTLIKILTGVQHADKGEIFVSGALTNIENAQQAQDYGIAAIYQEPMVYPDLDVAENIFISHKKRGFFVRWNKMYDDAYRILSDLGVKIDVRAPASGLTLAAQQSVEIAKAISLNVKVLIMDEPTASLSNFEVNQLFKVVRKLKNNNVSILFISHRLEEVFDIADQLTVLRDGKHISTNHISKVTKDSLIKDMVGRDISQFYSSRKNKIKGECVVSVKNISKESIFNGIEFDLYQGEVLGFAGLVGSRRTDVGLALFGINPVDSGTINLYGKPVNIDSPQKAKKLGIAYLSEDRRQLGLAMPMEITTNITLPALKRYLNKLGIINRNEEYISAKEFKDRLQIKTPSLFNEVNKLSGGNQQKVMLSKWLNTSPKIFILDEPTRGIDVGTKAEVHAIIKQLADEGMAIICISSDLPEVIAMSDRILVMREGRQMGIVDASIASQENIMSLAMGQKTGNL